MPESSVEFELKFLVPRTSRAAVRAALAERGAALATRHLLARYFDTADRRLARAGLSLRLRREGRQWVQTLKAGSEGALARFEHEVLRPDASLEAAVHAGTTAGDHLAGLLADGEPLHERYGSDIRRTLRRLRTRGAVVEVAYDEGRIVAQDRELRVCELEFELLSGSRVAMLALAERWRARLGLVVDPRSKAERGDALAEGAAPAGLRKARPVALRRKVELADSWRAVLDECIAQILVNAIGLAASVGTETGATARRAARDSVPAALLPTIDRADLVHQLRIGLRRLRSAIRFFRGWVVPAPEAIEPGARELFRALGVARDRDVLAQAIEPALQRAGAPARREPASADDEGSSPAAPVSSPRARSAAHQGADDVAALVAGDATQRWLLALLAWRAALDAEPPLPAATAAVTGERATGERATGERATGERATGVTATGVTVAGVTVAGVTVAGVTVAGVTVAGVTVAGEAATGAAASAPLAPLARRRLARWQRAITDQASRFAHLDDTARHALRKRAKRLRYASEFVESLFSAKEMRRFLGRLQAAQQALGELSDLALAAERYARDNAADPRDWFVLGWVAARREAVIAQAAAALSALGERHPFGKR